MVLDRFLGGTICRLRAVRKRDLLPGEDDISEWSAAFAAPPRGRTCDERVWAQGARCNEEVPNSFPLRLNTGHDTNTSKPTGARRSPSQ